MLSSRLQRLRSLRSDTSGLALMEFAFTFPIIMAMGGYGTELSFLALSNLRVSQYALNLADNASRVGVQANAGVTQLRESDLNDVLQGTRRESDLIKLTTNGRVILSSLENVSQPYDTDRVQRIHWQRCLGMKGASGADAADYNSHYDPSPTVHPSPAAGSDATAANKGVDAPAGMGEPTQKVNAYQNSGVMFVEVNYQYRPLFGSLFVNPQVIRYTASFIVRDNRDFSRIYNPTPTATASTCDRYTKGVGGATT
ncbi:TadE/TadG family type IV pilus assembly protein [Sphingomonas sp.]|uniref:TadE/TadG family type IV pilus assembly protein n=1 Tax=Sphingomonas sp. TaxID=28214 RepID=UPI003CC57016